MAPTTATHLVLRTLFSRLSFSTSTPLSLHLPKPNSLTPSSRPFFAPLYTTLSATATSSPIILTQQQETETEAQQQQPFVGEEEKEEKEKTIIPLPKREREVPKLTVKEKKELGSFANSLGDKLKSQQVGKSGVTGNVIFALDQTLEKNELLKLKLQSSCPDDMEDAVSLLERSLGAASVFQIGRTVILYRPSVTKLNAEKKKEEARKHFEKKKYKALGASMKKEEQRRPGRGAYETQNKEERRRPGRGAYETR